MKAVFRGQGSPLSLLNGKEYEVLSIERGWYRVIDESGEDYLYPPEAFWVSDPEPAPPVMGPPRGQDHF